MADFIGHFFGLTLRVAIWSAGACFVIWFALDQSARHFGAC